MIKVNPLLVELKITDFGDIFSRLNKVGFLINDAVDGGAGLGAISEIILKYGNKDSRCFAFEPFTGNHRFFKNRNNRVVLIKKALGAENCKTSFEVSSQVAKNKNPNLEGYSSVGRIAKNGQFEVDCVKCDDELPQNAKVNFVKLDLQGGEYNALKGMRETLKSTKFMWIEYIHQSKSENILEIINENDFIIFDTQWVFINANKEEIENDFNITSSITLTTGNSGFTATKKTPWINFKEELDELKQNYTNNHAFLQTDLFCVKKSMINTLNKALNHG